MLDWVSPGIGLLGVSVALIVYSDCLEWAPDSTVVVCPCLMVLAFGIYACSRKQHTIKVAEWAGCCYNL